MLKKSLLTILLLGITGFGVTELVVPKIDAKQDAVSRQTATRVIECARFCLEHPLQRLFVQKYLVASLSKRPWSEPVTTPAAPRQSDASTPSLVNIPRAPIAPEERHDYSAEVQGYTLFAIPVVTVHVIMTATGDLIDCAVSR